MHRAPRQRLSSLGHPRHLIVAIVAAAALAGCRTSSEVATAARDLQTATRTVSAATHRLMTDYPRLETQLDPLRTAQPSKAAARIRAEIIPLFDAVATGLETAASAEERYVAAAGKGASAGDAAAIAGIAKNAVVHRRQAAAYAKVRDGYATEAKLLDAGPVPAGDARALVQARIAVLQHI